MAGWGVAMPLSKLPNRKMQIIRHDRWRHRFDGDIPSAK
jgi:hypothetical protein